jgi:hypothetical protein
MTTNAYLLWSAPTDHRMRPLVTNYGRTEYIRDIMVRNGDAHKPIWISEMNSNALPVGPDAEGIIGWGAYGQVSLETQAEWAPLAYERAQAEWPYVGVVNFWFFKPASDLDSNQAYYYFRMIEPDFTPLPVYEAIKTYTSQTPRMYAGTHQEDHWAITWEGEWFDRSDAEASAGHYRVAGSDAIAHACVEENEFKVLQAPASNPEAQVTVERGDDGCLTMYADPGAAIDGFVVDRESGRPWMWALAILPAIFFFGWAAWRSRRRFSKGSD